MRKENGANAPHCLSLLGTYNIVDTYLKYFKSDEVINRFYWCYRYVSEDSLVLIVKLARAWVIFNSSICDLRNVVASRHPDR